MKFFYCVEREMNPDNFSSLIQTVIGANYSHAFILVKDIPLTERIVLGLPREGDVIFEATTPVYGIRGVKDVDWSQEEIVHQVEIMVRNEFLALGWLVGNMGKEYSMSQCLGFLDSSLQTNFQAIWGNGEGRGVCSEFCARFGAVNSTRPDFFIDIDLDFVNPKSGLALFTELLTLTT